MWKLQHLEMKVFNVCAYVCVSNLQLPRELHVVVVDQDVGNELLLPCREGRGSLCDVWTDVHFQECVRTSGAVPHLQTITTITTSHGCTAGKETWMSEDRFQQKLTHETYCDQRGLSSLWISFIFHFYTLVHFTTLRMSEITSTSLVGLKVNLVFSFNFFTQIY